jgi:hypothetical protein
MVQSLTPFRYAGRKSDGQSPLDNVFTLNPVKELAISLGHRASSLEPLFSVSNKLFQGEFWSYQPIDLVYHDLAHTAQASYCYLELTSGYARIEGTPATTREFELGLIAILLHDTGFLKVRGDDTGTGAKYTHSHVLRSCALAASLLPNLGLTRTEIDDVSGMIRCTGLTGNPEKSKFSSELARTAACMVATADYIGQMAAPDYPAKLDGLFSEFEEADNFSHVPAAQRMFTSSAQLMASTGDFWQKFVLTKLNGCLGGVYRYLASPLPERSNPYLESVEHNLLRIAARK